jgi:acyl dehydratase
MGLLVDGGLLIAGGLVGRSVELEWPRPTRPADVLHVDSEIVEIIASHTHPVHGTVVARGVTRSRSGEVVQIT